MEQLSGPNDFDSVQAVLRIEEISRNEGGIASVREMEEEEHEVYGGEIPVEGEMDGDVDMSVADDDAVKVSNRSLFLFLLLGKRNQKK